MEFYVSWNDSTNSSLLFNDSWRDFFSWNEKIQHVYAISVVVIVPLIIVVNAVLIINIVSNMKLRNFRHLMMVSIGVADALRGFISCPIRAAVALRIFENGCATYLLVSIIQEYMQIFVGTWGLVIINFDFLLTLQGIELPRLSPLKSKMVATLIVTLPWLAMFIIVLPTAYLFEKNSLDEYYFCYLKEYDVAKQIIVSFTVVIPGLIIVCQSIVMTAEICRHHYQRRVSSLTTSDIKTLSLVFVIAGVFTVSLVSIEQCGDLANAISGQDALFFFYTASIISDLKSVVTPSLWFAIPELRAGLVELVNRFTWRRSDNGHNGANSVIYYRIINGDTA